MTNILSAQTTDLPDECMHIVNAYAVMTVNVKYLISLMFLFNSLFPHVGQ